MVLLNRFNIDVSNRKYAKSSFFMIERFNVPKEMSGILLSISIPYEYVKLVLVYDSCYNLRAEATQLHEGRVVRIHQKEIYTSSDAKHGRIHEGEWIIAFKLDKAIELDDLDEACIIEVHGDK